MTAEFEEKEYEIPLNTQLLLGNRNIWTPGQVFEGNFGIDAALEVTRGDFWQIVEFPHIPSGVIFPRRHIVLISYGGPMLYPPRPLASACKARECSANLSC